MGMKDIMRSAAESVVFNRAHLEHPLILAQIRKAAADGLFSTVINIANGNEWFINYLRREGFETSHTSFPTDPGFTKWSVRW